MSGAKVVVSQLLKKNRLQEKKSKCKSTLGKKNSIAQFACASELKMYFWHAINWYKVKSEQILY